MSVVINGSTGVTAPAFDGSIDAADLTGTLPAIDGSALTGISSGDYVLSSITPSLSVTASNSFVLGGVGTIYNTNPTRCAGWDIYIDVTETNSTSFVNQRRITVTGDISGTVRFNNSVLHGNYGTGYIRLLKNGSEIVSFTNTGSTVPPVLRTVDASVQQGDVFQWQIRSSDGVTTYAQYGISSVLPTIDGMETASNSFIQKPVTYLTTSVLNNGSPYVQDI